MEFLARVATPTGQIVERSYRADSESALRSELNSKGLYVFWIRSRGRLRAVFDLKRRKRLDIKAFMLFNHELATLLKAGMPVVQSLEILMERVENPHFREALHDIHEQVKSGVAVSDAFAEHPELFTPLYASSLKAGERSGDLEGVIRRYLRYIKVIQAVRKQVTQAFVYPAVLVTVSFGVVFVLLTFAIPKFADLFESFGRELPLITRLLLGVSELFSSYGVLLLVGAFVGGLVLRAWNRTPAGALAIDRFKLWIPLVGGTYQKFALSQLTRALSTLLGGGIPLVTALEIAAGAVSNRLVSEKMGSAVALIREGESLSHALEHTSFVTPMVVEMVRVGESTGALTEMLSNVADYYDEDIESELGRLVTLLEPLLLVVMGSIIAVMLFAMYLPIFGLQSVQFG